MERKEFCKLVDKIEVKLKVRGRGEEFNGLCYATQEALKEICGENEYEDDAESLLSDIFCQALRSECYQSNGNVEVYYLGDLDEEGVERRLVALRLAEQVVLEEGLHYAI